MIFELAEDFRLAVEHMPREHARHRMLELLERALRRDLHFIDRHRDDYPQLLFQQMWNHCWWYRRGASPPPEDAAALHAMMEKWRHSRESSNTTSAWLAAEHPLPWQLDDDHLLQRFHSDTTSGSRVSGITDCSFSWFGQTLLVCSEGRIEIRDAESGRLREKIDLPDCDAVFARMADFDTRLIFMTADRQICCWELNTDMLVSSVQAFENAGVALLVTDDRQTVIAVTQDPTVFIWHAGSGELIGEVTVRDHDAFWRDEIKAELTAAAVSAFPDRLVVGSVDGDVVVVDVSTRDIVCRFRAHDGPVVAVDWSPCGEFVVTCSDGEICLWRLGADTAERRRTAAISECIRLRFAPDGRSIVVAKADGSAMVLDAQDLVTWHNYPPRGGAVISLCFDVAGSVLAVAANDGTIELYDWTNMELQPRTATPAPMIEHLKVASNLEEVASADSGGRVCFWNAGTWMKLHEMEVGAVQQMGYCPNGEQLVLLMADSSLKVLRRSDRQLVTIAAPSRWTRVIDLSVEDDRVAALAVDCIEQEGVGHPVHRIYVWRLDDGVLISQTDLKVIPLLQQPPAAHTPRVRADTVGGETEFRRVESGNELEMGNLYLDDQHRELARRPALARWPMAVDLLQPIGEGTRWVTALAGRLVALRIVGGNWTAE